MNKYISQRLSKSDVSYGTLSALFSERLYQEMMWNKDTTTSGGNHSDLEFLVFIDDYLREAINIVSRNPEPQASTNASEIIRKISAMILASAEKNDWIGDLLDSVSSIVEEDSTPHYSVVESLAVIKGLVNKSFDATISSRNKTFILRHYFSEIFVISVFCMTNHYALTRTLSISEGVNFKLDNIKKDAFDESVDLFLTGKENDRQVSISTTDDALNYINILIKESSL